MRLRIGALGGSVAALALVASGTAQACDLSQVRPGPDVGRSVVQTSAARLAGGPITIGQTGEGSCGGAGITAVMLTEAGAPSYEVATPGVLTAFSHQANGSPGQVRAVVFGPSPTPGHLTVMGKSAMATVVPGVLNTFPIRIPVQAGQRLGITQSAMNMACGFDAGAGDDVGVAIFDPDASNDFAPSSAGIPFRVNISAVLEPDVDGDQYGDISQDACPQSALTQAACPAPETKVTKRPAKRSEKRRVKVTFTSSVPGSTFTCSLDKKRFKPCTSPFKKRLRPGKHKLLIQAVSPAGIPEGSPAKVRFRILQRDA